MCGKPSALKQKCICCVEEHKNHNARPCQQIKCNICGRFCCSKIVSFCLRRTHWRWCDWHKQEYCYVEIKLEPLIFRKVCYAQRLSLWLSNTQTSCNAWWQRRIVEAKTLLSGSVILYLTNWKRCSHHVLAISISWLDHLRKSLSILLMFLCFIVKLHLVYEDLCLYSSQVIIPHNYPSDFIVSYSIITIVNFSVLLYATYRVFDSMTLLSHVHSPVAR